MLKIAVALSKGGVGKTTTAVNLAAGLARSARRVLLLDIDTQGQAARSLGCVPVLGLAELVQGEASLEQALTTARLNLDLLPAGRSLAGLKRWITRQDIGGERALLDALAALEGRYDYVILDTAPGWDALTVNALFYADVVLSPVSLEVMTLQGLMDFNHSLAAIQKYRPGLSLRYVLPTFYDRRVRKSAEIYSQLNDHFGARVCAPIRYSVRLSEAPGYGQTIYEYAPTSTGAEDYRLLTERIIHDDQTQGNP